MDLLHDYTPIPQFRDSAAEWLIALAVATGWFLALLIVRRLIARYDARLKDKGESHFMQLVTATLSPAQVDALRMEDALTVGEMVHRAA